jgi:hypothetical protein
MRKAAIFAAIALCACSSTQDPPGSGASAGSGGSTATGGSSGNGASAGSGGSTATGGSAGSGASAGSGGSTAEDGGLPDSSQPASDAGAAALGRPSMAVVTAALAAPLSSYHRNGTTGDIWCTPCDGAPVVLAAAALAGEASVDARLLAQIREVLGGGKDPFATGGYAANDERNVTAMFAIAKKIPRIWSRLTAAEIHKIDLIMEATLVADIYLTADKTNATAVPRGLDGDTNHDRDWNPNYREGMIGAVLVATEYFGGQKPTEAILAAYDHATFTAELQANGLANAYWVYSTYQRDAGAGAPSPQTVKDGITGYLLKGMTLGQLLDIYVYLANDTFSAAVACGLNGGAGILVGGVYAGRIVSGCAGLPNLGAVGMEKEFDSVDAEGKRSSAGYVRLGVRTNLFNQLVLLVYGDWKNTTQSAGAIKRVNVGVTDFFYKATQGYEGYSHAKDEGLFKCGADMDCEINQAIWKEILAPAHGL